MSANTRIFFLLLNLPPIIDYMINLWINSKNYFVHWLYSEDTILNFFLWNLYKLCLISKLVFRTRSLTSLFDSIYIEPIKWSDSCKVLLLLDQLTQSYSIYLYSLCYIVLWILMFLVAKLLYKSKCPSVCMYVCLYVCVSGLGGIAILSAPNWDITQIFFVQIPLIIFCILLFPSEQIEPIIWLVYRRLGRKKR